ncbi:nitronate monooxygenase [Aeoliella mucimassa]|uniref:Nitronate monooxygenase n=1 Tax=Aeoliella mucimassa TaxID=2527972 RepID=A0A518AVY0_9BACT|nr:nitronate monooxygenase [Aeoliella mucimassa]QDU58899.1 Nitronate monooxygenase [Aeoliella mucimassa]
MPRSEERPEPIIIQGGMGVAVSDWRLAKAVSQAGQLGVVSGTAIETVLVRRLQQGDAEGHMRRALDAFPYPAMAKRIVERYFVEGGIAPGASIATTRVITDQPTREQLELVVAANFVEIYLAKEDHSGVIGVNYLEKIQTPTLPSLFGAMLAGVDYVLMGAGIPKSIPGILDRLQDGLEVELPLHVEGATDDDHFVARFNPMELCDNDIPWLNRPKFLAIVASATLASMLRRKSTGQVDGFVIEGPTAGGHNAPPRGKAGLNERGEPIYGDRDDVDLNAIAKLGLPYWLAGSCGSPEGLRQALDAGAAGIQVGTAFAFCNESGILDHLRHSVLADVLAGKVDVLTDPLASPTGFPIKVLQRDATMSDDMLYAERNRVCDLGYLCHGYRKEDGSIGWRCPGEPAKAYVHKGGEQQETVGRKCICNGLLATVGLEQHRGGKAELPLLTCGLDVANLGQFVQAAEHLDYSAAQVIEHLLTGTPKPAPAAAESNS